MHSLCSPILGLYRVPLVSAAVLSVVLLFLFPLSHTQAAFHLCRTDPIVTLSNGDIVSIYVEIAAEPTDVKEIQYTLHVPKGVTAVSIVYLGTEIGLVEKLTLKADAKPDQYRSETKVVVSNKVAVTATTWFETQSVSDTGKGGEVLKALIDTDE